MFAHIHFRERSYRADLSHPLDISIPLRPNTQPQVNCFYAPLLEAEPVRAGNFVGSTSEGGPLNFFTLRLNPHGNGTHTECVGHIAREPYAIREQLRLFHFLARLYSVYPEKQSDGDRVVTERSLQELNWEELPPALILRTLPNTRDKLAQSYSGSNPPYVQAELLTKMAKSGVQHLLLDLPSVDREEDGGALAGHRAFWQYPDAPRTDATITELIYVPDEVVDGLYLLNLQIINLQLDASPSKPVLYALQPM